MVYYRFVIVTSLTPLLNVDSEVCEDRIYTKSMFNFAGNTETALEMEFINK